MRRALAVAIAAGALAGCGGDDKPTKEEFARDAERLCVEISRDSDALRTARLDDIEDAVPYAQKARAATQDAVRRVRELEVPGGEDGERAKAWQDAVRQEAEEEIIPAFDDLERAARENDAQALVAAVRRVQGLDSTRSDRLARELGADRCA